MLLIGLQSWAIATASSSRGPILAERADHAAEAYAAIDWPVLVMLGSPDPGRREPEQTGRRRPAGALLALVARRCRGYLALGLVMVVAMLVTPLLHHAPRSRHGADRGRGCTTFGYAPTRS